MLLKDYLEIKEAVLKEEVVVEYKGYIRTFIPTHIRKTKAGKPMVVGYELDKRTKRGNIKSSVGGYRSYNLHGLKIRRS